ncbi:MAG: ribosome-recycling factor [Mycoplasmataceae bacterium]|nr:ribosome-recycling factor [Mycoplasmataceae bacterium]
MELIENLDLAIISLETQLSRVTLSGANPQLFSNLKITYYDEQMLIGDLSSITIPEAQQLIIKPFDKETVKEIYKTIEKQNYKISMVDEGHQIRIIFPILTTEKRQESVKQLSSISESAKVKIRNARQSVLKMIKLDKELSDDMHKHYQDQVQIEIDLYNGIIDKKVINKKEQLLQL